MQRVIWGAARNTFSNVSHQKSPRPSAKSLGT
jgi:hypothetical protein